MIRLIMCEGSNELEIMRILIKNNKLIFGEDDLLGLTPYHARQLNNSQVKTALNIYPGNDVLIMRIGDVQNEKLKDFINGINMCYKYMYFNTKTRSLCGITNDFSAVKRKVSKWKILESSSWNYK